MRPQVASGFLARLLESNDDSDEDDVENVVNNSPTGSPYNPPSHVSGLNSNSNQDGESRNGIIGSPGGIVQPPYLSMTDRNSSVSSASPAGSPNNINQNSNARRGSIVPPESSNSSETLISSQGSPIAQNSPGARSSQGRTYSPGNRSVTSSCAWDESDSEDSSDDD